MLTFFRFMKMLQLLLIPILIFSCSSSLPENNQNLAEDIPFVKHTYHWNKNYDKQASIAYKIESPSNFQRVKVNSNSFESWLRFLPLKSDNTVYLYNGNKKGNQSAQYAVIDIDIGSRDLQQCADAVMRLRAEYLLSLKKENEISFNFTSGDKCDWKRWKEGYRPKIKGNNVSWSKNASMDSSYANFKKYMTMVFNYAGTLSLEKELQQQPLNNLKAGDVFIKGGSPGHAAIVIDVAENENGEKVFLLAQSYMPAQNIHILKNPNNPNLSPWYKLSECKEIVNTPEWTFTPNQLKTFH